MGKNRITGDQENRLVLIEQGKHASLAFHYSSRVVDDLEQVIIRKLVQKYRSNGVSDDELRGAIGEIVGLRSILSALEQDMKKGHIAQEEEIQNGR